MKHEYVILSLGKEYPGYVGTEKWMIITDLSEEQFVKLHPEGHLLWKEAVILSTEMGKEIIRYHNNERKHEIRNSHMVLLQEIESVPQREVIKDNTIKDPRLKTALKAVTRKQRRRIVGFYQDELTLNEIAEAEGCSTQAIGQSIDAGIERMKKCMGENTAKKVST